MTRRQQIEDAAQECYLTANLHEIDCFVAGAKWADSHPCVRTAKGARPCEDVPKANLIRLTGVELPPPCLGVVERIEPTGYVYVNPYMIGLVRASGDYTELGLKNERIVLVKESVDEIIELMQAAKND